jgi:hypothetical protein
MPNASRLDGSLTPDNMKLFTPLMNEWIKQFSLITVFDYRYIYFTKLSLPEYNSMTDNDERGLVAV